MTNIYEFKFSLMDLTLASQILNIQYLETQSNMNQSIFTTCFKQNGGIIVTQVTI